MVTWWRERRQRHANQMREYEEHPTLSMLAPVTRFALEAQLLARNLHKDDAIAAAKQAMDEHEKDRRTEASMAALRDRTHELGTQLRNERP